MENQKYRVVAKNGKYFPQRYDDGLKWWINYKIYNADLSFENKQDAWGHIKQNPNSLNVSCD